MIKIVAKNTVKKENKADFINTAKELIEKSRAEDGCISYTLNESLDGKLFTPMFALFKPSTISFQVGLSIILAGALIGGFASLFAARKYLKMKR